MATQAELDQTLARLEGLGYGKPMRELFMQDPDYVQMNHGSVSLRCHHSAKGQSAWRRALTRQEICATADANDARVRGLQYGAIPRAVFEAHQALAARSHFNYDVWNGEMIGGGFLESRQLIGELITADTRDVVMVENASMGMNAALRCLQPPLARGDKVIYLSTEYGMTHSVLNYLESAVGIVLVQVDMVPTAYQSDDAVMAAVETAIADHGGARAFAMGVISHISSQPAVVLPVARFCAALSGVPVVVDGAHAPGTIHLDVPSLGAAAYTGNLHKWMCVLQ